MGSDQQTIEQRIGYRLRKVRQGKKMTLDQMAARTSLSKGLLSRIENGKVSSPVATLAVIAQVLDVKLSYFVDDDGRLDNPKIVVVRPEERLRLDRGAENYGFYYDMLAHKKSAKLMEAYIMTLEEQRQTAVLFTHPGEELIYVLQGRMEFTHGQQKFEMSAGDCTYFEADLPHGGRNLGPGTLQVLIVMCHG